MPDPAAAAVELHSLDVDRPGVLPFAIGSFAAVGPLARAGVPHRHSFYEIGLVTRGRATHVVDLERHDAAPPYLYAMVPGQVHHWEDARDMAGWLVLFDEDFLLPHPADAGALRTLSARGGLRPGRGPAAELHRVLREMDRERRAAGWGHADVLSSLLHVFLLRAVRVCPIAPNAAPTAPAAAAHEGGRPAELVACFRELVARGDLRLRTVERYARELGVSPSHLHDAVKRGTGRTPGQLIRARQVLEAKRLLVATDLTVAQIASASGFADPAYFCRFFRRETGTAPGRFRAEWSAKSTTKPQDRPSSGASRPA
ncbi:AraC family transcriptional regulator [Streptomyces sp. NPDC020917]|uniref:AraC family transcriptional regulator n=1 Tax=Streptomyces sp. NPDC020917 TaxID=3365102 RepID=UPI0037B2B593